MFMQSGRVLAVDVWVGRSFNMQVREREMSGVRPD